MSSLFFPGVSALRKSDKNTLDITWFTDDVEETSFVDGYVCKECGIGDHMLFEKDEVVCTKCGTLDDYPIDSSAEFRWFGNDDRGADPTRVGHPINPLFPESTGGTRVLSRPGDSKAMRRIQQFVQWTIRPYRERTLWGVFDMLETRSSQAGIPKAIVDETKHLYAQVSPFGVCRGAARDGLVAACLYESLKRHGTPWRPAEVAAIFQIDTKQMTRGSKLFSALLDEHFHKTDAKHADTHEVVEEVETATHTTGFEHYLENAVSRLLVPKAKYGAIQAFATTVGRQIDFLGICSEMTPSSLLGSALLLACEHFELNKTASEVAGVCKISAATLQKCMKKIAPWRPVLLKAV